MNIPVRQYWKLLVNYLRPQSLTVIALALLLSGNIGLRLVIPQFIRRFIDMAQAGEEMAALFRVALIFIGIALVQQVSSVLSAYLGELVGWTATNSLRNDLVQHCLNLDMGFHNAHTPGEMIERLDGDVTSLANFFSQFVIQLLGNSLLLLGVLVMLFLEDWRVGSALSVFSLAAFFVTIRFRNFAVPHWAAERQASAELFGFLEERLAGTEDIRANGAVEYVMRRFYQLMRTMLRKSLKAALMINIFVVLTNLLFALGTATAFAVGALLFQAQMVTIGTVYIIFQYTTMIERPINIITRQLEDLQKAGAGILRIQELFNVQRKIVEHESEVPEGLRMTGPLFVGFQGVTFGYDDGVPLPSPAGTGIEDQPPAEIEKELVLRALSFDLPAGKTLGLLGRTGSGKTTLTRLLIRLYDPDEGAIYISSDKGAGSRPVDLRSLPVKFVRQRIGMVTQNVQLFHATVRENLTFFDPGIRDERILEAVELLGLRPWLDSLPDGLDTELESGGGLSAGEAQLLAFTRIFLKDPGLVVLDEASSLLDPATEELLERAIDRLLAGRSAVIIAHRLRTVERADEIMILENGAIVEQGGRRELSQDPNSRFYHLLSTGMEEVLA